MRKENQNKVKRIAKALGASRTFKVSDKKFGTPLGWIEQAQLLQSRLKSTGGRPSNPEWEVKRLVPFSRYCWEQLKEISKSISSPHRKVGPAQLSAMIIQNQLETKFYNSADPSISIEVEQMSSHFDFQSSSSGNDKLKISVDWQKSITNPVDLSTTGEQVGVTDYFHTKVS